MRTHARLAAVAAAFLAVIPAGDLSAEDLHRAVYGVATEFDVVYGSARVGVTSATPHRRELKMDVYRPLADGKPLPGRPAVILAFGGAFHRGSKGTDRFEEDGASDTPMGDYCRAFAADGYVCSSIEYRLVPDDPALPADLDTTRLMPKAALKDPLLTGRIDVVRARMGLPPLDEASREQLWNTVFAAAEDMASAISYVRAHAGKLGVDPERIAIGGFSAGGLAAVNAAYGAGVPVQAVISLSGGIGGYDLRKTVRSGMPPALLIVGQNDLDGVRASTPGLLALLHAAGVGTESAWMPGFGHFYPTGATSLGSDMSKLTLEGRLLRFLERNLGAATPPRTP